MTNHPNRSTASDLRYVVYSVASHQALAHSTDVKTALKLCRGVYYGDSDEFFVVFVTRSKDNISRFGAGRWPRDAKIVWRGSNELTQRYRAED